VRVSGNERADQLAGDAVENDMHLFDILIFFLCNAVESFCRAARMVMKWEEMLTLFGLWFHFCLGFSILR
jgi:hypothetical protein